MVRFYQAVAVLLPVPRLLLILFDVRLPIQQLSPLFEEEAYRKSGKSFRWKLKLLPHHKSRESVAENALDNKYILIFQKIHLFLALQHYNIKIPPTPSKMERGGRLVDSACLPAGVRLDSCVRRSHRLHIKQKALEKSRAFFAPSGVPERALTSCQSIREKEEEPT